MLVRHQNRYLEHNTIVHAERIHMSKPSTNILASPFFKSTRSNRTVLCAFTFWFSDSPRLQTKTLSLRSESRGVSGHHAHQTDLVPELEVAVDLPEPPKVVPPKPPENVLLLFAHGGRHLGVLLL